MMVQITPVAIERIGYGTYIIFAVLDTAWVPVIYFLFSETRGLELEDVDRLFGKDGTALQAGREGPVSESEERFEGTG